MSLEQAHIYKCKNMRRSCSSELAKFREFCVLTRPYFESRTGVWEPLLSRVNEHALQNNHRPRVVLIITVLAVHVMRFIKTVLFLAHSFWNTHVTTLRVSNLFLETPPPRHVHTQTLLLTRLRQEHNSSNYSNSWYLQLNSPGDEIINNEMDWTEATRTEGLHGKTSRKEGTWKT